MSGKIFKRAIAILTLSTIGILPLAGTSSAATSLEVRAMDIALTKQGDPYVWGATGPNAFDCSGLVYYAYTKRLGHRIPRIAQDQYNRSQHISYSNRRPGDLVFFGYGTHDLFHVGIYIGVKYYHGAWRSMMVAAPYTGARVRVEPIYGNWDRNETIVYGRIN